MKKKDDEKRRKSMTKEQVEKIVAERLEERVNKLVEEALAAREAEILKILEEKERAAGKDRPSFLKRSITK